MFQARSQVFVIVGADPNKFNTTHTEASAPLLEEPTTPPAQCPPNAIDNICNTKVPNDSEVEEAVQLLPTNAVPVRLGEGFRFGTFTSTGAMRMPVFQQGNPFAGHKVPHHQWGITLLKPVMEEACIEIFTQSTLAMSNAWIGCKFWNIAVQQYGEASDAVKHAICALGCWHLWQCDKKMRTLQMARFALDQYGQALRHTARLIADKSGDTRTILTSSLLLAMFDHARGEFDQSGVHLSGARKMAVFLTTSTNPEAANDATQEILNCLGRFEASALAYASCHLRNYRGDMLRGWTDCLDLTTFRFGAIEDARSTLVELVLRYTRTEVRLQNPENARERNSASKLIAIQGQCAKQLRAWYNAFCRAQALATWPSSSSPPILMLLLWWHAAIAAATARSVGAETRFDALQPYFENLCKIAQRLLQSRLENPHAVLFGLDAGCIPSLWFAVCKCRQPDTRRQLLEVMRCLYLIEGAWNSAELLTAAVRCVQVEEAGLRLVRHAQDVPEVGRLARIRIVESLADGWLEIEMTLSSCPDTLVRQPWVERVRQLQDPHSDAQRAFDDANS
jgi:hypothetical protein